jgi:hypothetical protein
MNLNSGTPTVTGNTFTDVSPVRIPNLDPVGVSGFSGNTYSAADPWFLIQGTVSGAKQLGLADLGKYNPL